MVFNFLSPKSESIFTPYEFWLFSYCYVTFIQCNFGRSIFWNSSMVEFCRNIGKCVSYQLLLESLKINGRIQNETNVVLLIKWETQLFKIEKKQTKHVVWCKLIVFLKLTYCSVMWYVLSCWSCTFSSYKKTNSTIESISMCWRNSLLKTNNCNDLSS